MGTNVDGVKFLFESFWVIDSGESSKAEPLTQLVSFHGDVQIDNVSLFHEEIFHGRLVPIGWEICEMVGYCLWFNVGLVLVVVILLLIDAVVGGGRWVALVFSGDCFPSQVTSQSQVTFNFVMMWRFHSKCSIAKYEFDLFA